MKPWRAYKSLEWFIFTSFALAGFFALVAVTMFYGTVRQRTATLVAVNLSPQPSPQTSLIKTPTNTEHEKIPPSIKQLADKYIIELIGKSEFEKNYVVDYEKSQDCNKIVYGCYISYKFLPGDKYGGSEYLLYYDGESVEIANNGIPINLPSCERDLNNCNFVLSLDDLKEIARKESLNDKHFKIITKNQKILIEVSYCNLNTMENRKKILIDPTNGNIVWRGSNEECQGIF